MTGPTESSHESVGRDPDADLMAQVANEVPGAFEELVSRYQNRVLGVFFHMVGNLSDAEDLAQDLFLRVYRNRKNYKPQAKFSTWIFTIANNLALNAIRDRKRKQTSQIPRGEHDGSGSRPLEDFAASRSGATPSRIFAKGELSEIVRAAVAKLSEEQRMAVMLNKFEHMNYKQIGEVMNRSEMAVKSLLSRARTTLKEMLVPYVDNGRLPPGL